MKMGDGPGVWILPMDRARLVLCAHLQKVVCPLGSFLLADLSPFHIVAASSSFFKHVHKKIAAACVTHWFWSFNLNITVINILLKLGVFT